MKCVHLAVCGGKTDNSVGKKTNRKIPGHLNHEYSSREGERIRLQKFPTASCSGHLPEEWVGVSAGEEEQAEKLWAPWVS